MPPINNMAELGFGAAGAALMAARRAHRAAQERAANYQHPPSIPFAHPVGRPGDAALEALTGGVEAPSAMQGIGGAYGPLRAGRELAGVRGSYAPPRRRAPVARRALGPLPFGY